MRAKKKWKYFTSIQRVKWREKQLLKLWKWKKKWKWKRWEVNISQSILYNQKSLIFCFFIYMFHKSYLISTQLLFLSLFKCCRISVWQCSLFVIIISPVSVVVTLALQLNFRDKLHCQYFLSLRIYCMPNAYPSCTNSGLPRWLRVNCNFPCNHLSPIPTRKIN